MRIHHIPGDPNWNINNFWPYNHSVQTFTLDIVQVSDGSKWRLISTNSSGIMFMGWTNLTTGINVLHLSAEGENRQYAGFEIDGNIKFRKFLHTFTTQNWGYEEILVL